MNFAKLILMFTPGIPWILQQTSEFQGEGSAVPVVAAISLSGVLALLNKVIEHFYTHDFSHADND